MTIAKPRWWEYIIMEDADGVGVVTGFKEGTPQDIIDEYFEYLEWCRNRVPWIDYRSRRGS